VCASITDSWHSGRPLCQLSVMLAHTVNH
ncbi:3-methyladenine DNA glycosylase, partial [Pseudomonas aeruginosa]